MVQRRLLVLPLLLSASFISAADPPRFSRDPGQPIDEEYSRKIKEYTTLPSFLSPLVDYLPASKTVPTPKAVLGDVAGAPGKLPCSAEVYRYMRLLEKSSPRVKVYSTPSTGARAIRSGRLSTTPVGHSAKPSTSASCG